MSTNGPSEDGYDEQNAVDAGAEQVDSGLDQEFLSILQQLDQGTGETHAGVDQVVGDAINDESIPSFEQSWQESAGNATSVIGPESSEPELEANSGQNQAVEDAPATIPMDDEYVPEPADQPVDEVPGQESWRNLPDIDADGPVDWVDFREAA